jgi:hypothetical protein
VSRNGRTCAAAAAAIVAAAAVAIWASNAGYGGVGHRSAREPRMLFGLGPEADGARASQLVLGAPVHMLTSWFNGTSTLSWMTGWKASEVPRDYAAGFAMHLVVWSGQGYSEVPTRYGTACGQAYPLSPQFLRDMEQLAEIFRPPHGARLYVTLLTEFQTYACEGNEWSRDPQSTAYLKALQDQYIAALRIFHARAPGSEVSLGWGGWQARWDNPPLGGGRSLFEHFAKVMRESDFQSFEVIGSDTDASDILEMTHQLRRFGPVMLAYYKPREESIPVARAHLRVVLSPRLLVRAARAGLFAFGVMDDQLVSRDPQSLAITTAAIRRFGCGACGPG